MNIYGMLIIVKISQANLPRTELDRECWWAVYVSPRGVTGISKPIEVADSIIIIFINNLKINALEHDE